MTQITDVDWRDESWSFNDPCRRCRVRRLDHAPTEIRHAYVTPALAEESIFYVDDLSDVFFDTTGGTVERAIFRHSEREANGGYDAPLPPQAEKADQRESGRDPGSYGSKPICRPDHNRSVGTTCGLLTREETQRSRTFGSTPMGLLEHAAVLHNGKRQGWERPQTEISA